MKKKGKKKGRTKKKLTDLQIEKVRGGGGGEVVGDFVVRRLKDRMRISPDQSLVD